MPDRITHRQQRGELIRRLILDELSRDSGEPNVSAELSEIVGIRLMLMNVLKPAIVSPSLRVVRLTEPSLSEGIERQSVEGVTVRVYSAAKTVADCFKFRNKIGLDIAIEALKDCLRQKKATINEIYRYAKICRVSNVIRPYMEAL